MTRSKTWVEIDERALQHNIEQLRGLLAPETRFCAVVKANAYGHGLREVAMIASRAGVDAFAVDNIDEALAVRSLLPSALILVLGYTLPERFDDAIAADIHLTLYDRESIDALEQAAGKRAAVAPLHLKVETGTSRQGVLAADLDGILQQIHASPHIRLAGVSTHFANIEDTTDTRYANLQFARFQEAVTRVRDMGFEPEWIHCACSAAVILYPDTHGTMVRTGIAMYGIWPSPMTEQTARKYSIPCDLIPVLSWKTRIAQVKSLPAGTPVGYGLTEVLKKNSRIAVLPVGYWDGYDRHFSSRAEVVIGGVRCPILGRICMNMCMADVSNVPNVEAGQDVLLLGRTGRHDVTADKMATWAETIPYEILTRINPLLPRVIV